MKDVNNFMILNVRLQHRNSELISEPIITFSHIYRADNQI